MYIYICTYILVFTCVSIFMSMTSCTCVRARRKRVNSGFARSFAWPRLANIRICFYAVYFTAVYGTTLWCQAALKSLSCLPEPKALFYVLYTYAYTYIYYLYIYRHIHIHYCVCIHIFTCLTLGLTSISWYPSRIAFERNNLNSARLMWCHCITRGRGRERERESWNLFSLLPLPLYMYLYIYLCVKISCAQWCVHSVLFDRNQLISIHSYTYIHIYFSANSQIILWIYILHYYLCHVCAVTLNIYIYIYLYIYVYIYIYI